MVERTRLPVCVPGITDEQEVELERRISEFEKEHEDDLIHGRGGYVPVIKNSDFIIAWVITLAIGVYYFWAILS